MGYQSLFSNHETAILIETVLIEPIITSLLFAIPALLIIICTNLPCLDNTVARSSPYPRRRSHEF